MKMSISSNNLRINKEENLKDNQKSSTKKRLSLQDDYFKKEIYKKLNEGCVLNFIRNSKKKDTIKTNCSEKSQEMKYDLSMLNKYDEDLNSSLSFISEFDLEEDEEKKSNESFDSFAHDDSGLEIIEIKCSNKKVNDKLDENDDIEFEKEWNDIQNFLLNK
jgi:D-mannonate dehydratase